MITRNVPALLATAAFLAALSPASPVMAQEARIQLNTGHSQLFTTPQAIERVAVSDPKIATVHVISAKQILIQGLSVGNTSMMVWTKGGGVRAYDVMVGIDTQEVQRQLQSVTGNDSLSVTFNGQSFVLTGQATVASQAQMAEKMVASYGRPVINMIQSPQRREQIAIEVFIVELSKNSALNLGITPGGGEVTELTGGIRKFVFKPWEMMFGEQTTGNINTFSQMDFLAGRLELMQKRGEAKVLARPTLVTVDGGTAKFLAGGEIPIPIQQALGTISIVWKEFGVRLEVQPTMAADGRIALAVKPEVSSLDYTNGLKQVNFNVPAIRTRRAETTVMLRPLETLMLGGLMDNERNHNWDQLPFLGDLPILGELFKSRRFQDNQTELAIMVTPRMVVPSRDTAPPGRLPEVKKELTQEMEAH